MSVVQIYHVERRSQDGGGVGRGEPFLPHKFIKRTFKRRVNSTKQLLNAGRGHQAPRKATQLFKRREKKYSSILSSIYSFTRHFQPLLLCVVRLSHLHSYSCSCLFTGSGWVGEIVLDQESPQLVYLIFFIFLVLFQLC